MVIPQLDFPLFFFFNDTATTEIYTLSLHDALPIFVQPAQGRLLRRHVQRRADQLGEDRKSTRLNSSHRTNSYAVFCLKKKNQTKLHELKAIKGGPDSYQPRHLST